MKSLKSTKKKLVHILTLKTGIHLLVKLLFISKAMSETHY